MTGTYRLQVKFDRYCYGYSGRMARITVTTRFDREDGKIFAASTPGCLIIRESSGSLKFQPVMTNIGSRRYPMFYVSPDIAEEVLSLFAGSKWADGVGSEKPKSHRAQLPHEIDPSAPTILGDQDIVALGGPEDGV